MAPQNLQECSGFPESSKLTENGHRLPLVGFRTPRTKGSFENSPTLTQTHKNPSGSDSVPRSCKESHRSTPHDIQAPHKGSESNPCCYQRGHLSGTAPPKLCSDQSRSHAKAISPPHPALASAPRLLFPTLGSERGAPPGHAAQPTLWGHPRHFCPVDRLSPQDPPPPTRGCPLSIFYFPLLSLSPVQLFH